MILWGTVLRRCFVFFVVVFFFSTGRYWLNLTGRPEYVKTPKMVNVGESMQAHVVLLWWDAIVRIFNSVWSHLYLPSCPGYVEHTENPPMLSPLVYCKKLPNTAVEDINLHY